MNADEKKAYGMSMEEQAAKVIAKNVEGGNLTANKKKGLFQPSVVEVHFPGHGATLPYYNDCFELQVGDGVYVDGKLAGKFGVVTKVNYNFKIDLDIYRRIIAKVDTEVHGTFYNAKNHCFTTEPQAIPAEKVRLWMIPPKKSEKGMACGWDDSSFPLNDLNQMHVTEAIWSRGINYYLDQEVVYLSLDGSKGYALVEGSEATPYEVEFYYQNGEISRLTCDCYCTDQCKHMVAVMLQLREMLTVVQAKCGAAYEESGYFAAIYKPMLMRYADLEHRTSFVL